MPTGGDFSQRILVLAPIGRDGELLATAARDSGLIPEVCKSVIDFCEKFKDGCGVALLTEEALYGDAASKLPAVVEEQPAWSEVPFIVLASKGQVDERVKLTLQLMQPLRNATVIERPVRPGTIVMALDGALRDRRRQYEVRDALESQRQANLDLEKRVEERTADLVAKVVELEGFTYSVSHDMRAPLRAIVSNAAFVLEDEGDNISQDGKESLARLSAAANKMAQLVDDLLKYARLGTSEPKREHCNLSEIAKRVANEVLLDIGLTEAIVDIEPDLATDADPRLLGLVLQNLIDNAFKYRPHSRIPTVEIGQEIDGPFFVRDNGIGFDMQYASKIFKPFERLHRDEAYPGTGIGLANVQRIIERHGGKVWAEGKLNSGASFYFTLS